MEMRDGFMRPPRNRGGLMWPPPVPLRGRNMMGMERMRLPHLRPGMMRGGPPVPPFVGRGMTPPHARPRGMLPRPPIHPPGPMLGPRGIIPRPILPPRALGMDAGDASDSAPIPVNGAVKETPKNVNDGSIPKNNNSGPIPHQIGNQMANRNIRGRVRPKGNQNIGHPPLQNMHPTPHHPQPPPVQPNSGVNPPHMVKHLHPIQSQINSGGVPPQGQPHHMQHQPALRGGRNGMNPRNRGPGGMGRGGLMNIPPLGGGVVNRGNAMMNRGGPPNMPPRAGPPGPHGRGNMMGALPPPVPYAPAPPPPQSSFPVPPPVLGSQGPMKRGGPPMGMPPPMPPKRVRYDSSLPANGYGQYQQPPPPQAPYSSYDAPPPSDMYNSPMPPPPLNSSQSQNYNSSDYNYPSGPQSGSYSANAQYSSYNNDAGYSSYSGGSSGYDQSVEYSNNQSANNSGGDPYGYKGAAPSDSYGGYSNSNYYHSQAGYDDYSSGYMDGSTYGAPVQDSSYGQSVGTYNNYSY